jgi:ABC-type transport system substrate-binding protein
VLLISAACGARATGPSEPTYGGTLTVALDGEIDTIDPHKSVTIVGFQVYTQIFEGLVHATATLDDVYPLLAESWEQTDDVTYLFTLRQGVTFHNGKGFTAEDVIYSYNRIMDEAYGSARRADLLPIESLEAVDDHTVIIETIFAFPGIGSALLTAVNQRDYPIVQGITLVVAIAFSLSNLLVDILYTWLNPRIQYE